MENFTNSNLNLILGVKEGCHFDRVQKPTIVIAILNGQCLETKKIQSDCNPCYASELTWETDKTALRKMRCNSTPIKVECYAVNESGSREKLGYILLSVRSAQIIYQGEESKIKTSWHNILGVRNEFNNCKPRLMLYLIIKERDTKTIEIPLKDKVESNMIPKWLQDEHLIQLGPLETCRDIFLLQITAETLTNLNYCIKEYKNNEDNNDFILIYNIFEMFFKLKPFKLNSDYVYLNQKIFIKIRSSVTVIADYINSKSNFLVRLKTRNVTIGQSEIKLLSLLSPSYLHNMKETNKNTVSAIEYNCILKNVRSKECNEDWKKDESEESPVVKIFIKLSLDDSKVSVSDSNSLRSSNDIVAKNKFCLALNHQNYSEKINHRNNNNRAQYVSSSGKILQNDDKLIRNDEIDDKSVDIYKSYCLSIRLSSITFFYSKSDVKNIEFSQKGDIITTVTNQVIIEAEKIINLSGVKCDLHFISTTEKIEQLLSTFAPIINVCDSTFDDKKCIAQLNFDVKKLFFNKRNECQYTEDLIDCHTKNKIGIVDIIADLDDGTSSSLSKKKENSEIIFNNEMVYKIVDELENWKEQQKEIFKEELQKKEKIHLTLLNEEWQRRRQYLESKLTSSKDHCKILANNLSKAAEDLKQRKIQSFEKETNLIQVNEELQWKYERKVRQLQDALEKMQTEFTIKLRTLEEQNKSLILQIESLNDKNYKLEKAKVERNEKLIQHEKTSSSLDQTNLLLQQLQNLEVKLEKVEKTKQFFKEEWDKATKEITRLKMETQIAVQSQIRSSKEELHNFDLEEILHADSAALTFDQIALNEIQKEINVMNQSPFLSLNCEKSIEKLNLQTHYDTNQRKLRTLIDKRDNLLKKGSYTSKDGVIIKLNADIRSLLMKS